MTDIRLLILDDDHATGQTIEIIARSAGLDARFTSRPDTFFELVGDWAPTHIALDLLMPEMDGVEVLGRLSRLQCLAKIIITSGVGQRVLEAAGRSAAEHGLAILGVLPKPFTPSALRTLLLGRAAMPNTASFDPVVTSGASPAPAVRFTPTVTEFERALHTGQFEAFYQPQVNCANGALAGFEALARWRHPEAGLVMPNDFIQFAESNGLIDALTDVLLDQALRWFSTAFCGPNGTLLPLLGGVAASSISLAVNLSARTLSDASCITSYVARCQQHGVNPAQVRFELTETGAMENPLASLDVLTRLRLKGFQLSIDDVGTGFSSMLQLVKLPFSEMKVDRFFVGRALREQEKRKVVEVIVGLGHGLGIPVTAEGVEDAETLAYLRDIGCDHAQGYHLGRPMSAGDVAEWMALRQARHQQTRSAGA